LGLRKLKEKLELIEISRRNFSDMDLKVVELDWCWDIVGIFKSFDNSEFGTDISVE